MQCSATVTTPHVNSSRGAASAVSDCGDLAASATANAFMESVTRQMVHVPAHQDTEASSAENHAQLVSMAKTAGTGVATAKGSSRVK